MVLMPGDFDVLNGFSVIINFQESPINIQEVQTSMKIETITKLTPNWVVKPHYFIAVTSEWAWWRLKSPVSRLFAQPFVQVQIKDNIHAPIHWPLWGESTGDRWIPLT